MALQPWLGPPSRVGSRGRPGPSRPVSIDGQLPAWLRRCGAASRPRAGPWDASGFRGGARIAPAESNTLDVDGPPAHATMSRPSECERDFHQSTTDPSLSYDS